MTGKPSSELSVLAKGRLIFIYGTLRKSGGAHHLIAKGEWLSAGTVAGQLVHVDQYPGLILNDRGRVFGDLYLVDEHLMRELDQYEGCFESPPHYTRESVYVLLDDQTVQLASVYVFQRINRLQQPIEWISCGDWIGWYGNKKA